MDNLSIIQRLAEAGFDSVVCLIAGCPFNHRPMNRRSWSNHTRLAHLDPTPTYHCPYLPCTVVSSDPGMRVHV